MSVVRAIVILIALALMAVGGRLILEGLHLPGIYLLAMGVVVMAATFFERWRYGATASQAPAAWQRTDERFEDPESGRTMTVYFDPVSGERRYVSEAPDAERSGRRHDGQS
ncbi:MAG TPA: hypothetical protein VHY19_15900 [Steroidobacteraceae bacterium]|jgi:hypothetical protein|nr:hypothetical protein [Steroidobacteraceae bacterium]